METTNLSSPFEGTPWSNDEEIYDFAIKKKQRYECDWNDVVPFLTAEGLDSNYAQAIVENLKVSFKASPAKDKKSKRNAIIFSVIWAVLAVFIIRPISYMMSPDYGRYIFIGIIGIGFGIINQYRKGENAR